MQLVMARSPEGDLMCLATDLHVLDAMSTYKLHWSIECLFRALKSKDFQLEGTHMTLHDHVERLLCLLTLTYTWCVLVGVTLDCPKKAHGRRAWSVVKMGLRELVRSFSRESARLCDLIDLLMPSQTNSPESVGC
ncbi:transposase [Deinococcus sp. 6GRE01]|uniref:transposase n=1 Tax=Deinococcus sp. 6GRE01 TaxID=2745873 RepID=UPI001E2BB43C|nr:transposase [Deinococcus sp. 6GRE01]MCD0159015.1 transposase [Deinococcus sp. 6GRE01]